MRPPRVRTTTFDSCHCFIYHNKTRAVLDFTLLSKLVYFMRPFYEVSVRQCESLRPTSFRFHLAMDTLVIH
ncbi:hypothetical protein DOS62_01990 [Staphylococcus felis]|nr:hypothetical protein DOS62_01990 [Staphylococcus felis]